MQEHSVLALLYDFDKTLCTKDMQEYTFIPKLGLEPEQFWAEANGLAENHKMDRVLSYMYLMINKAASSYVPVRREDFVELGKDLEYFPGVEAWFERINAYGREMNMKVEHYIISSGLREVIEGSSIFKHFREVFACEFSMMSMVWRFGQKCGQLHNENPVLVRINKGVLDISNDQDLNEYTPEDERQCRLEI